MTEAIVLPSLITNFIERWASSGAAERANYQIFLTKLCDVLEVPQPEPTRQDEEKNSYVFEKDSDVSTRQRLDQHWTH